MDRYGIERAVGRAVVWTLAATAIGVLGLTVPEPAPSRLLVTATLHLTVLVVLGLTVAFDLRGFLDDGWFAWLGPTARRAAAGASVVALTTGVVALATLVSSASLRLAPSLQFLQLLSGLDIAWATGATIVGAGWLWGRRAAAVSGFAVAAVCIWSIWTYLRQVGFAAGGGWQVDGAALFRYVLPFDMMAAVVAVAVLATGARSQSRSASSG